MQKEEKQKQIENFLEKLGASSEGIFYIVCGNCGASDKMYTDNGVGIKSENIENEVTGHYSDYTGHLWDSVNIKCKECGNAISFTK